MTDDQISEIYSLARESFFGGQKAFQIQAYPFRMTPLNMAKHRNNPHFAFWKMLKQGSDHFEASRLEPKVSVCEKRYVFDAEPPGGSTKPLRFDSAGRCPVYEVPQEIAEAVKEKREQDEKQFAQLVQKGTPTVAVPWPCSAASSGTDTPGSGRPSGRRRTIHGPASRFPRSGRRSWRSSRASRTRQPIAARRARAVRGRL